VSTHTDTLLLLLLLRLFIIVIYLFHKPEKISLCGSLFDAAASADLFAITLLEMISCCSVHYVKSNGKNSKIMGIQLVLILLQPKLTRKSRFS
jgi:hypothetical protein